MTRLLCAKRCLSSLSLLSSSSSIKCCSTTSTTTTTFNHSHSSIKSFPLFSPLPTLLSQQLRSINSINSASTSSAPRRHRIPGCDFEHWLIVMNRPLPHISRDDIISNYIKTLATVVGSEEKAKTKIYSVSTKYYYAFSARISKKVASRLKGFKNVRLVFPDTYLDAATKDYGGEPFIDGQAVPYDPKYHKVYLANKERAKRFLIQQVKLREQDPKLSFLPPLKFTAEEVERKIEAVDKKEKAFELAREKAFELAREKNKPKRHTPVFLVFMEDFRKTYKQEHPENKSVVEVAKEGSKKWKTLTDEEKKQYFNRAAERVA